MSTETAHVHHEHPDVVGSRNRLGLALILVADIAFTLSMVFVFFYLKSQNVNNMWLAKGDEDFPWIHPLSSWPAWRVTLIAGIGMTINYLGLLSVRKKNYSGLLLSSLIAMVASFVATYYQWQTIAHAPFTFYMGGYVSAFYLLTTVNFAHLLITNFVTIGNWNRTRLGLYKTNHWHVDILNVWWVWMTASSALGAFCLLFG